MERQCDILSFSAAAHISSLSLSLRAILLLLFLLVETQSHPSFRIAEMECEEESDTVPGKEVVSNREVWAVKDGQRVQLRTRRRATRSLAERAVSTVTVNFSIPLSFYHQQENPREWTIQVATEALWKHWLYSRGLVGLPLHQIQQQGSSISPCENSQSRDGAKQPRQCSLGRAIQKMNLMLSNLESDWRDISHSGLNIQYVLFSFGPSWARSKEMYRLDVSNLPHTNALEIKNAYADEMGPSRSTYTLSTRLIREVVNGECEADGLLSSREMLQLVNRGSADQFSLAIAITPTSYDRLYHRETSTNPPSSKRILDKLLLRRDYNPAHKAKGIRRSGCVSLTVTEATEAAPSADVNSAMVFSLRATVKGLRLPAG
jgi:hypothetical protein